MEGFDIKLMDPVTIVDLIIKGMEKGKYEVYPGIARMLLIISRLAQAKIS
jgi:uncharacterized oxidoreductase